jgi:hypothetical protein
MRERPGGDDGLPELVWYVSYGSNLNRARFTTYIEGGSIPGNDVVCEGCTDPAPPVDDVSLELPHSLYFAGWSERAWGGTAAGFITRDAQDTPALARAYLITPLQLQEVVRQENANVASADDVHLDIGGARRHGHVRMLLEGYYSELIWCGQRDGYPMLSFTASENRTDFGPPSPAYLRMIRSGLQESHGLNTSDAVDYLKDRPGVLGHWTASQLAEMLSAETSRPSPVLRSQP